MKKIMGSVSPSLKTTPTSSLVTLAAGCFWGVEKVFRNFFTGKGLVDVRVGYANGDPSVNNVSYEKVCSGRTNFAESVQVSYEPSVLSLESILNIFFRTHDPTTVNAPGPDIGTQYRSAVMTHNDKDLRIAADVKSQMQKEWFPSYPIVTSIEPIKIWHDAEDYHQEYLEKNPSGYECPTHFLRTKPKV